MNRPTSPDGATEHGSTEPSQTEPNRAATRPIRRTDPLQRWTIRRWTIRRWTIRRWTLVAGVAVVVLTAWFARNWIAEIPARRARQAIDDRRLAAAERYLEYARWVGPQLAEAQFLRARLSRYQGDYPAAIDQLKQAEAWGWPAAQVELERWMVEAESGRTRQAAPRLGEITANPHAEPAQIFGALVRGCLKSRRSFPHAFGLLGVWSRNYPSDPEPHLLMARMSAEVRDWPRVEQSLQRALEAAPDDPAANMAFGELLVSRQRHSEARERFHRVAIAPRQADVRQTHAAVTREAECWRRLGRSEEARRLLDWVLREFPNDRAARVERALLELQERQPSRAIPHLEQVLKVQPEHPDANLALGQALQATGQSDAARRHFQVASRAQARWNRVSDLTWKVIENPDDVETRFEIASIQLLYGSEVAALEWFDGVFDLAPDHAAAVHVLVEHFREHPSGRDPDSPLVRHYARRFAASPATATASVRSDEEPLEPLTRAAWEAGRQRWRIVGPSSYEIEVRVAGRQAATYRTTVRDGQVARALRNGMPLTQSRTNGAWSVPGMFTTMQLDLERSERAASATSATASPSTTESASASASVTAVAPHQDRSPLQVELSVAFHPQWGFPERFRRVERGAGSTNPDVSWAVVRFDVMQRAEGAP